MWVAVEGRSHSSITSLGLTVLMVLLVVLQGMSRIIEDLFSDTLNLLIPCPNALHGLPTNVDKFLPNPQLACCPLGLEMYEFVGKMMGISLRANLCLPFQFPSLVWRRLLGQELTVRGPGRGVVMVLVEGRRRRRRMMMIRIKMIVMIIVTIMIMMDDDDDDLVLVMTWVQVRDMEVVDTLTCKLLDSVRSCADPEDFMEKYGESLTFVCTGWDG
jgi:hypothetical protein